MLFQARDLARLSITGEVIIDGLESFEFNQ
jgi:hypothetical protein